ncbi:MAG TPA: IS1595 family transposase [Bryobacteraceae bacterium]|nr:IS1595 family transposase [Bryobacteraceae bacterium]
MFNYLRVEQVLDKFIASHVSRILLFSHGEIMKSSVPSHMNLIELIDSFGSDDRCRAALEHLKWPDGPKCALCDSRATKIANRNQYDCDSCHYQFSVTAHSIFHDSHLSLWKWFLATYLITESKKGMSANQLKRTLKVSYQTAWYLCHRIRKAMEEVNASQLKGIVEIDETYVGGKQRHVGSGNLDNKTMVLGAVERGGAIRLRVEHRKKASRKVLHAFIKEATHPQTERLMTDENPAYLGIADEDTTHETVNHRAEEWVRGDVHTNTVEGVWSLFKRSLVGSFHQVSAKHLQSYLDEFEWRFNNRDNAYLFRDTLVRLLNSPKMEYKELIEKSA